MPKYTSISPYDLIFGDLHHGVNASVDGVTDRDGEAIVLEPRQVLNVKDGIFHALLVEHDANYSPERGDVPDRKSKATKGDVTVSEETTTATDSATK